MSFGGWFKCKDEDAESTAVGVLIRGVVVCVTYFGRDERRWIVCVLLCGGGLSRY